MPGRSGGTRTAFTENEDVLLVKYIATYNPSLRGRQGQLLYQSLVANADGKWNWSNTHSWQSWRERYKNNQPSFDSKIRKYQQKHGIDPNSTPAKKPKKASAPVRHPTAGPSKPTQVTRTAAARKEEEDEESESDVQASGASVAKTAVAKRPRESAGTILPPMKKPRLTDNNAPVSIKGKGKARETEPAQVDNSDYGGEFDRTLNAAGDEFEDDTEGATIALSRPSAPLLVHDDTPRQNATVDDRSRKPHPTFPKVAPLPLQVSQEPTPPRSGASVTPHAGTPDYTAPSSPALPTGRHTNNLTHHPPAAVLKPSRPKPPRRKPVGGNVGIFADTPQPPTRTTTPTVPPSLRRPREPPRGEMGPYVSSFTDAQGRSRLTAKGGRIEADESDSEEWPPKRRKAGNSVVKQAPNGEITRAEQGKTGLVEKAAPSVPVPMKKRAQVNAKASSSKVMLPPMTILPPPPPGPALDHTAPVPNDNNVKHSAATVTLLPPPNPLASRTPSRESIQIPRARSVMSASDPFSDNAPTEAKGKQRAQDRSETNLRRQTFGGQEVPHIDLREPRRGKQRQSLPGPDAIVDLLELRKRSSMSRAGTSRSNSARSRSITASHSRFNSATDSVADSPAGRRHSRAASHFSGASASSRRRRSAADQLLLQDMIVVQGMARIYGFQEDVVRNVIEAAGGLDAAARILLDMKEEATKAFQRRTGIAVEEEADEAGDAEDHGTEEHDTEEDDSGEEAQDGDPVAAAEEEEEEEAEEEEEEEEEAHEDEDLAEPSQARYSVSSPRIRPESLAPTSLAHAGSASPYRKAPSLHITPVHRSRSRSLHLSPQTPTRAKEFKRLKAEGRVKEALARERMRASGGGRAKMEVDEDEQDGTAGSDEENSDGDRPALYFLEGHEELELAAAEAAEAEDDPDADDDTDLDQTGHASSQEEEEGDRDGKIFDMDVDQDEDDLDADVVDQTVGIATNVYEGDHEPSPASPFRHESGEDEYRKAVDGWQTLPVSVSPRMPSRALSPEEDELADDERDLVRDAPREQPSHNTGTPTREVKDEPLDDELVPSRSDGFLPPQYILKLTADGLRELPDDDLTMALLRADDAVLTHVEQCLGRWSVKRRVAEALGRCLP